MPNNTKIIRKLVKKKKKMCGKNTPETMIVNYTIKLTGGKNEQQ